VRGEELAQHRQQKPCLAAPRRPDDLAYLSPGKPPVQMRIECVGAGRYPRVLRGLLRERLRQGYGLQPVCSGGGQLAAGRAAEEESVRGGVNAGVCVGALIVADGRMLLGEGADASRTEG